MMMMMKGESSHFEEGTSTKPYPNNTLRMYFCIVFHAVDKNDYDTLRYLSMRM